MEDVKIPTLRGSMEDVGDEEVGRGKRKESGREERSNCSLCLSVFLRGEEEGVEQEGAPVSRRLARPQP